ncbi:hypothetical protein ACQCPQ_30835 (plasmid) [Priestia megaterium]|uniref:hypothetical protein n=1 Tax=Priestia megaterium TaxID=1404 RepID=UPI003CFC9345
MYEKINDAAILPKDLNTIIWRYMDFTKFINLLEENKLYFTRADKFKDPYEGVPSFFNQRTSTEHEITIQSRLRLYERAKSRTIISCWHKNNYESAAMWDLYLRTNEGIAIQTTVNRLMECFNDAEETIQISKVNYIDFENDWMPEHNVIFPTIHKRISFAHEREIRAFHISDLMAEPKYNHGGYINTNLDTLIEKIYVAPDAPAHFVKLVKDVTKRYELDKPVIHSTLYQLPK